MAKSQSPKARYPEPELSDKAEKIHYWFDNGNRALVMLLTDTDDRLGNIEENMVTKADLTKVANDITDLIKMVREGFDTLGVNISNGDHRVGGRAIRPVK